MQASFRGFCAREELHRARQRRIKGDRKEAAFLLSSRLLTDFITEESETASTAVKEAAAEVATKAAALTQGPDQVADPETVAAAVLIQDGWRWLQDRRISTFAMLLIKLSMRKWARRWIAKHRPPPVAPPDAEAEADAATGEAGGGEAGRGGLLLLQEVSNWASQLFSPDAGAPAAAAPAAAEPAAAAPAPAAAASPEARGRSIAALDH